MLLVFVRSPRRRRCAVQMVHGNYAAMSDVARFILYLDRGVFDVEAAGKDLANVAQDVVTLGKRHIINPDMASQRVRI